MATNTNNPKSRVQVKLLVTLVTISILAGLGAVMGISPSEIPSVPEEESPPIHIAWAEWPPSVFLERLSKGFTEKTGVEVIVHQIPWPDFYAKVFSELNQKKPTYDIIVGDSQWLGEAVARGHYAELTTWIKDHDIDSSMTPSSIEGLSQYPKGEERYWAVPVEGDANGFAYRKDLFEDPEEKEAFMEQYGYELQIPDTWEHFKDIAEFFQRPEEDLYGVGLWTASELYDGFAMGFQPVLFSWGADWGDMETYRVKGILNTPEAADALDFYKELYQFTPPDSEQIYWEQSNRLFAEGKVAMTMNYFSFFPSLNDPKINPHAKNTGFFPMPKGPKGQYASLGGQGASLVGYSRNKEQALRYLKWFAEEEVQREWASLGGFSTNANILRSESFLSAQPYNKALALSFGFVKDFWTVPEYNELLISMQNILNPYVVTQSESTAEEALDAVSQEWESTFEYAGYYKE